MNKNFSPSKYWLKRWARILSIAFAILLTVLVVMALISLAGCTPTTSPQIRIATDYEACPARGMDDEDSLIGGAIDDYTLTDYEGEHDRWFHCVSATFAYVCMAYCNNQLMDIPGIAFEMNVKCLYPFTYYGLPFAWDGDGVFKAKSGPNGKAFFSVTHDQEPFEGVGSIINLEFEMLKKEDLGTRRGYAVFMQREGKWSSDFGGLFACSNSGTGSWVGPTGYYISSCGGSTSISSMSMSTGEYSPTLTEVLSDPNAPPELPSPKPNVTDLPLTTLEAAWVSSEPNLCPETGIEVKSVSWYAAKRTDIEWFVRESIPYIYPLSWDSESDSLETINICHPYFCSIRAELAEPAEVDNLVINAKCNGVDVNLYVTAVNEQKTNLVLRSDYIVACDIDSEDGVLNDDRGIKHVRIKTCDGETLKITIPESEKVKLFSQFWLTNSRITDINNDGLTDYVDTIYGRITETY